MSSNFEGISLIELDKLKRYLKTLLFATLAVFSILQALYFSPSVTMVWLADDDRTDGMTVPIFAHGGEAYLQVWNIEIENETSVSYDHFLADILIRVFTSSGWSGKYIRGAYFTYDGGKWKCDEWEEKWSKFGYSFYIGFNIVIESIEPEINGLTITALCDFFTIYNNPLHGVFVILSSLFAAMTYSSFVEKKKEMVIISKELYYYFPEEYRNPPDKEEGISVKNESSD